jgi:hypothetical protein
MVQLVVRNNNNNNRPSLSSEYLYMTSATVNRFENLLFLSVCLARWMFGMLFLDARTMCSQTKSLGRSVPWTMRPLDNASLGYVVPDHIVS